MKYKCKHDDYTCDFSENPVWKWKYACPNCDCCHGWEEVKE